MCLAVPMEIVRLTGSHRALARRESGEIEIDVSLLGSVEPGDFVIVHAGYALEVIGSDDAEERIDLLRDTTR